MKTKDKASFWDAKITLKVHKPECHLQALGRLGYSDAQIMSCKCDCDGHSETNIPNMVLLTGMYSIINKLIDINNTDTTNGFIDYMELGSALTAVENTQTGLVLPKGRRFMNSAARDATNAVFGAYFPGNVAVSAFSNIIAGTSTTEFTVQSGHGALYEDGMVIEVEGTQTVVTNVSGDDITVSPALPVTPEVGGNVIQCFAELGLFGGSSATSDIGTGIAFNRTVSFTPFTKEQGYGATVEMVLALT